jgi:hypothetical protein
VNGSSSASEQAYLPTHSPHHGQDMARKDLVNRFVGRMVPAGKDMPHVQIWKQDDPLTVPTDCPNRIHGVSVNFARFQPLWQRPSRLITPSSANGISSCYMDLRLILRRSRIPSGASTIAAVTPAYR